MECQPFPSLCGLRFLRENIGGGGGSSERGGEIIGILSTVLTEFGESKNGLTTLFAEERDDIERGKERED